MRISERVEKIVGRAAPTRNEIERHQRRGSSWTAKVLILICAIVLFLQPVLNITHFKSLCAVLLQASPQSVEERVHRILSNNPLIDGHVDLPILIRDRLKNHIYQSNFTVPFENGGMLGELDLPRLRAGQVGGAFWSVYVSCPANGTDFSDENYRERVQETLQQIDLMTRLTDAYPGTFSHPRTMNSQSALDVFRNQHKLISPLGVEGLHQIGNSVANLRLFYALGARYVTLTHNCHNAHADAAIDGASGEKAKPYWGGVSPRGRKIVKEMNRLGMIVDLSHVSQDTMIDVLGGKSENDWEGSEAPVMFSHSSAYSICPHPRNVPDDVLKLVKKTRSIVMVNFAPDFISCKPSQNPNTSGGIPDFVPENNTLAQVANHITYIGDLIGYDYVGIGSDFDGISNVPRDLEDVSKFPALFAELLRRGLTDGDAAKIAGGNILRVWKDVEEVARKLRVDNQPELEDDI